MQLLPPTFCSQFIASAGTYANLVNFFAQAIIENPVNPLKSAYAPSFLAAYRASIQQAFQEYPSQCARFWTVWTFAFSAAIVFGTIVTRGPQSPLASNAMKELDDACRLFSKAAAHSRCAAQALPILMKLSEKAHASPAAALNERPSQQLGQQWSIKVEQDDDELEIFAGKTRFVSTKRASGLPVDYPEASASASSSSNSNTYLVAGSTEQQTAQLYHPEPTADWVHSASNRGSRYDMHRSDNSGTPSASTSVPTQLWRQPQSSDYAYAPQHHRRTRVQTVLVQPKKSIRIVAKEREGRGEVHHWTVNVNSNSDLLTTYKHHRLNALGRSMTDLHHQFSSHRRKEHIKRAERRYKTHPRNQKNNHPIPKPKGRAGRKDGYKLIEAMGLVDRKEHYNALVDRVHMLADRYLKDNVTISGQDKLLVQNIMRKAQSTSRTLQKFDQGWPVYDMLAQYLRNRNAYNKKKKHKSSCFHRLADLVDTGDSSDSDSNATDLDLDSTDSDSDSMHSDLDSRQRHHDTASEDEETDFQGFGNSNCHQTKKARLTQIGKRLPRKPPTSKLAALTSSQKAPSKKSSNMCMVRKSKAPQSRLKPKETESVKQSGKRKDKDRYDSARDKTGSKQVSVPEPDEPAQDSGLEALDNTNTSDRISGASSIFDSPARDAHPSVFDQDSDDDELEPLDDCDDNSKFVSAHDIPTICPKHHCNDEIPRSPSSKLYDALENYVKLTRTQGHSTVRSLTLSFSICAMIKDGVQREIHLNDAVERGWPVLEVDFTQIPARVYELKERLDIIIFASPSSIHDLKASPFSDFLKDMAADNFTLQRLADVPIFNKESRILANAMPGYIMLGVWDDQRERAKLNEAKEKQRPTNGVTQPSWMLKMFRDTPSPTQNEDVTDPVVRRKPKKVVQTVAPTKTHQTRLRTSTIHGHA
ncbi:hypothetical protein DEU56DRAFT_905607 [Suillus clintonianus]|uniref:uncharacterized protein n=1 Tax=Suillus clintonianus TaxID=1904413 RepID=UPI001B871B76|nr:uncharacterized protein DEU56DRAFT_905607 [Suillus clintonianus]KAG2110104.1 hypothetical protein DEU56DRAFT_905607 [Suillus clintonianus]